ncbi:MAG: hypothetical protein HDR83_09190 [Bacteroides sp.]|nr:hypothetical protein [Bacteroidales bacterium]MBD5343842.1 hypothetical protein [Bacteroides sp.]MBD5369417.1 hypothetical protein [Bacteroides sp.]
MKKIILSILSLIAVAVSASAINLQEAYSALSNVPNINVRQPDANLPVIDDLIIDGQIAGAYNLDAAGILETGTSVYTILNQIPLSYMINGGNNNQVAAFVYATPNEGGSNDILVVVMSGYKGSAVSIYGTATNETVKAIKSATFEMQGQSLNLSATVPDVGDFNITLNKGR